MKINSPKKRLSQKTILFSLLALIIVASILVYILAFHGNIFGWSDKSTSINQVNYDKPSAQQTDQGSTAKESFNDKYYPDQGTTSEKPPEDTSPTKKEVGIVISSASQSADNFQIRTVIQTVNEGKCTLTMTREGSSTLTRSVETQNLGSYSTCKGFDIPLNSVTKGTWSVRVDFSNNEESSTTNQKIEVE